MTGSSTWDSSHSSLIGVTWFVTSALEKEINFHLLARDLGSTKALVILSEISGIGSHASQALQFSAFSISREENVQAACLRWLEGKHHCLTMGLGLIACLLQGWKGSEKWNCYIGRALGSMLMLLRCCCVCWLWPSSPWLGRGAMQNDFFHGKSWLCELRFEGLNLSPLGESQAMRKAVLFGSLSVSMTWQESLWQRCHEESLWLRHWSLLPHKGEFVTNYRGWNEPYVYIL